MTTPSPTDLSYPRQEAATRRFQLGRPRAFRLAPAGDRVAFIRSSGGRDPIGSLWSLEVAPDGSPTERIVVDAHRILNPDAELPAAERARRERMRETTAGITAFSSDTALTIAAFSLDGALHAVALDRADAAAVELPHPGSVVDPQVSPDGTRVAFVSDRSLYVVAADGTGEARLLCAPESEDESWGLADFVAGEELDRSRGLWWTSSSAALFAELVDEAAVEICWISDPANPTREPVPHRYPAAGTANPIARLFRISLDGSRLEIDWDHAAYPYLATVRPDESGGAVVSVLSRDQQRQLIIDVTADGTFSVLRERITTPWLTLHAGVPSRGPDGVLLEIVANTDDDCFQLVADGRPLTPAGLNVTGLAAASAERLLITASADPLEQHVLSVSWEGGIQALTTGRSVNSVIAGDAGHVIASAEPTRTGTAFEARLVTGTVPVASLAEQPVVSPVVTFHRVGKDDLMTAVLWPTGHVPGSAKLPVVMTPYGGPHHSRVVAAASGFASDQWLADQGFAVVVVDGRGTPGRGPAWEFAVHHDLATQVLADQVDALQALAAIYPDLDLTRVGMTGWSFGGYLAALAVLDRPDVFHAAVAGAPPTDWALYDTAYTERYLGLPQENPDVYASNSLLTRAAQLERPLLIIHGLADDNVLVANTLRLSSALLAAGKAHSVLPLSGVTHMTPQEIVAENLLRLEVEFLSTHLA